MSFWEKLTDRKYDFTRSDRFEGRLANLVRGFGSLIGFSLLTGLFAPGWNELLPLLAFLVFFACALVSVFYVLDAASNVARPGSAGQTVSSNRKKAVALVGVAFIAFFIAWLILTYLNTPGVVGLSALDPNTAASALDD